MTTSPSLRPEQEAARDIAALSTSPDGVHHAEALSEVQAHAAKFGIAGAKEEKAYWQSFQKEASAQGFPQLEFGAEPEGRQTSVKMGGETLYDRSRAVDTAKELGTVQLGKGEGPYQALVRSGMTNEEAKAAAAHIEEATGRKYFKQGEQFSVDSDGSVSIKNTSNGRSTETIYGAKGGREKTVEHANDGSYPYVFCCSSFLVLVKTPFVSFVSTVCA